MVLVDGRYFSGKIAISPDNLRLFSEKPNINICVLQFDLRLSVNLRNSPKLLGFSTILPNNFGSKLAPMVTICSGTREFPLQAITCKKEPFLVQAEQLQKAATPTNDIILQAKNITKIFPGTVALDNVDFNVYRGKVNVLVGENGAGKSTLMKIIAGVQEQTSGKLLLEGETTTARITAAEKRRMSRGEFEYFVTYAFKSRDDVEHSKELRVSATEFDDYREGQQIDVVYLPSDPDVSATHAMVARVRNTSHGNSGGTR